MVGLTRASRTAYFATVGRTPAIINLVVNLLIGFALFGWRDLVPWTGDFSIGADLLFGGFIVASATAWSVVNRCRRDAEAGVVAGRPAGSLWRLLPRRRFARCFLIGLVVSVGLLLAIIPPLEAAMPEGVAGFWGGPFKGLTCVIAGHLAIIAAGNRSLVGIPDITAAHLAAVTAGLDAQGTPFESLDKGCLACTSRRRGISVAPTWHLRVTGTLPDEVLAESFHVLCDKYPSLRTRVLPVDGTRDRARDFLYVDTGDRDILKVSDAPLSEAKSALLNRHLDLFSEPPVQVTRIREGEALHLLIQQHHAIADGRAFIGLLDDWAAIVRALARGDEPDRTPVIRRPEVDALERTPAETRALTRRGFFRFVRERRERRRRPLLPVAWNRGTDYSGANETLHLRLDDDCLDAWAAARRERGVSTNSLFAAAYLRATRTTSEGDTTPADRLRCELIAETRPRDGSFVSFANHLSAYAVEIAGPMWRDLWTTAEAVQKQVRAEHDAEAHLERVLFQAWGVRRLPIDTLRELVLDRAELKAQCGFSNLIPLPFPTLEGEGWQVDEILVSTPAAPPHGLVLTAMRYGGRLTFNFNVAVSVVGLDAARALADAFVEELRVLGAPLDPRYIVAR